MNHINAKKAELLDKCDAYSLNDVINVINELAELNQTINYNILGVSPLSKAVSRYLHDVPNNAAPALTIIQVLLDNGANPDYIYDDEFDQLNVFNQIQNTYALDPHVRDHRDRVVSLINKLFSVLPNARRIQIKQQLFPDFADLDIQQNGGKRKRKGVKHTRRRKLRRTRSKKQKTVHRRR